MEKRIIQIDENSCIGCGACARACKQGAIKMVDGRARLVNKNHCDGLGFCLPACPVNAISFKTVKQEGCCSKTSSANNAHAAGQMHQCPSAAAKIHANGNWPVKLRLANPGAAFFENAHIVLSADCCAYVCGNLKDDIIKDKVILTGCPKFDGEDYAELLYRVLENNDLRSLTVVKMEVPCCFGIEAAAKQALAKTGKNIPLKAITLSVDGKILEKVNS